MKFKGEITVELEFEDGEERKIENVSEVKLRKTLVDIIAITKVKVECKLVSEDNKVFSRKTRDEKTLTFLVDDIKAMNFIGG